ncbi:MAG: hypothetical protein FWD58_00080 [Firmicutes bacterium]|nr:hypothetical protein [Bacillota bacterium]
MLLSSFDIAPESGDYRVVSADGTLLGSVRVLKGGVLPPGVSGLDYFEFECGSAVVR